MDTIIQCEGVCKNIYHEECAKSHGLIVPDSMKSPTESRDCKSSSNPSQPKKHVVMINTGPKQPAMSSSRKKSGESDEEEKEEGHDGEQATDEKKK